MWKKTINTSEITLENMKNKIDPQKLIKKLIPIFYKAGSKSIQCAKKAKNIYQR